MVNFVINPNINQKSKYTYALICKNTYFFTYVDNKIKESVNSKKVYLTRKGDVSLRFYQLQSKETKTLK